MEYKKNQILEVQIEDIGINGEGIGKINGYPFFVSGAVVGDLVRIRLTKVKKTFAYAKTEEILIPSGLRVEPLCPVAGKCGGCQLQEYSYQEQLNLKYKKVKNHLTRIGGFDEEYIEKIMSPVLGMEEPWHYRNKAQYPVGEDTSGNMITGFYGIHSHRIIPTEKCLINWEGMEKIPKFVLEYAKQYRIPAYDEKTGNGILRHIMVRHGRKTGEWMACFIVNLRPDQWKKKLPGIESLVKSLQKIQGMKSISLCFNTGKDNVILGDSCEVLWGKAYIEDEIGDVRFQISPLSFYQVNPVQTEILYRKVLDYAFSQDEACDLSESTISMNKKRQKSGAQTLMPDDQSAPKVYNMGSAENPQLKDIVIWDLYCGIGTISLFLAKELENRKKLTGRGGKVYGVEIVPQAIENAKINAEQNGLYNTQFYVGKAEEVVPEHFRKTGEGADVIVVDPPRKGCDAELLEVMLQMRPERIVYVSCDSATLARDLKILTEGNGETAYELREVQPVDMFAMTVHVETVVCLINQNAQAKHHVNVGLDAEEYYRMKENR